MRIALGVEYDGSQYCGWQRLPHATTVQGEIEKALSTITQEEIKTICAGRTDSGVHALQQVIHFDTDKNREMYNWVRGINANLPTNIRITWAQAVSEDFHARFSALSRRYRYVILNCPIKPALFDANVTWEYRPLDISQMQQACEFLIGKHDFTSYRAVACQAHIAIREVKQLSVSQQGELITLTIEANAFLYHMVRNIAGVLMDIGAGKHPPIWAKEVLENKDRSSGGKTAAPNGLYFQGVSYSKEYKIPSDPLLLLSPTQ